MGDASWSAYNTPQEKSYSFKRLNGKALRFRIKAPHDCHVAFSSIPEDNEDMFEVFIGGWKGQNSAVRFKKNEDLVKEDTPGILSDREDREFWITFDQDIVRVGRGGEWNHFMEAYLPEHIEVTHFGYSTGWGASGWWQFMHERKLLTDDCLMYNYEPIYGTSLTFGVSCRNDCHVALTCGPHDTDPMYEILIGGWANQKSAIRLNKDPDKTVTTVETQNFVYSGEERIFWVTFQDGHIRVGRDDNPHPFMEYLNPIPWKVTHMGYCTGWGSTGQWKLHI